MLLQTNSYIVPKDKRSEHARLLRKFRATLQRLGCDAFEVYEQVGSNWSGGEATGRFVQLMRFRDRQHQIQIQQGEKTDPEAQKLIEEFCALINFPYQQQQGLFAVGFYTSAIPVMSPRNTNRTTPASQQRAEASGSETMEAPETAAANVNPGTVIPPEAAVGAAVAGGALAVVGAEAAREAAEGETDLPLDFSDLAPDTVDIPPTMRLVTDDEEADIPEGLPPLDAIESANGDHVPTEAEKAATFSDTPEAMLDLVDADTGEPDILTDEDREAIVGELTGDDVEDAATNDDEQQTRSRAR